MQLTRTVNSWKFDSTCFKVAVWYKISKKSIIEKPLGIKQRCVLYRMARNYEPYISLPPPFHVTHKKSVSTPCYHVTPSVRSTQSNTDFSHLYSAVFEIQSAIWQTHSSKRRTNYSHETVDLIPRDIHKLLFRLMTNLWWQIPQITPSLRLYWMFLRGKNRDIFVTVICQFSPEWPILPPPRVPSDGEESDGEDALGKQHPPIHYTTVISVSSI